jgi:drug/metabolite transporter (DMT)-like permease
MKSILIKLLVYTCILFAMIFWSLSFIWYKEVYLYFSPITTVFFRLILSSILLLAFAVYFKKLKIDRSHFKLFLTAALFEPFLYFLGESFGMQRVSSITAAVIISTVPVFTPLFAMLFFKERLSLINVAGIFLSFTGVGLILLKRGMQFDASPTGIGLMFLAVISAVGYGMALKRLTQLYEPLTIIAFQNMIGAVLFAPLFFIFDFPSFSISSISYQSIVPILKLGIFASTIAFILYAYGVKAIGISKVNIFVNLIPVITTIFAYYILKEYLTPLKSAGIIIVVMGLFLSQIEKTLKNRTR